MQNLNSVETNVVWVLLGVAVLGIAYALILYRRVVGQDRGTARMQEVWEGMRQGTDAYLGRQERTIIGPAIVLALVAGASVLVIPPTPDVVELFGEEQAQSWVAGGRALSFILGALCAYLASSVSMRMAVHSSVRLAAAARKGYAPALRVSYGASNVAAMLTVGLGLLSSVVLFSVFGFTATDELISLGFGSLLVALVLRTGGGVYVHAADTGAELVRKIEMGMPEDELHNPAVVAALVGDNAADSAGAASDMFASLVLALVAAMILGLALGAAGITDAVDMRFMLFPLMLWGVGLVATLVGTLFVRTDERRRNARAAVSRGFFVSVVLAVGGSGAITWFLMRDTPADQPDWRPFLVATVGILLVVLLQRVTEYFTATSYGRVKQVGQFSRTGSTLNMLSGFALGFNASLWKVVLLALGLGAVLFIYRDTEVTNVLYGVSLAAVGFLALAGNITGIRSLSPIAVSARWIGRIVGLDKNARNVVDDMDAVGGVTRSVARSYATGASVLVAVALLGAFMVNTGQVQAFFDYPVLDSVTITALPVLIGLLIGGAMPLLCQALVITGVLRVMAVVVDEARRQFKRSRGTEGVIAPDYAREVVVGTSAVQRELLNIALVAVLVPVVIGFLLGLEALGSFLIGLILAGLLMVAFQTSAGSAWAGTRRYIEDGNFGGRHSEAHKAALISDAMGKALGGSAEAILSLLIKGSGLLVLVLAPAVVTLRAPGEPHSLALWGGLAACLLVLLWVLWQSRRESPQMTELSKAAAAQSRI